MTTRVIDCRRVDQSRSAISDALTSMPADQAAVLDRGMAWMSRHTVAAAADHAVSLLPPTAAGSCDKQVKQIIKTASHALDVCTGGGLINKLSCPGAVGDFRDAVAAWRKCSGNG